MNKFFAIILMLFVGNLVFSQSKMEQDRTAILSMAGCYEVTFHFAETFSPIPDYKYFDRYTSRGIEYVFVLEDKGPFISLQHLLVMSDSVIIKHWRQDWVYEETALLSYDRDKTWRKVHYTPEQVKGTWTQKVFQVDDSPRYESKGTWVHVDGKHYWEGTGDSPLPRREFTKRSDYNVLRRHSRMQLAADGWFLEQNNEKILRDAGGDKLICQEKGMERFTVGNFDCTPAIRWWEENKHYWQQVRTAWNDVFERHEVLTLTGKVEGKLLWERLFELGDEALASGTPPNHDTIVNQVITPYIGTR
jgi:hypothetical protein